MFNLRFLGLFFGLMLASQVWARTNIDSLNQVIQSNFHDTVKISTYIEIGDYYKRKGDYKSAVDNCEKALHLSKELKNSTIGKRWLVTSYKSLGQTLENTAKHTKTITYFEAALKIAEQEGFKEEKCSILGKISLYYYNLGDYPIALDYAFQQLKYAQEIGNKLREASANNKVGIVYKRQMQHDEALKYLQRSLDIYKEIDDMEEVANEYNNIGDVYLNMGRYSEAFQNYQMEEDICRPLGIGGLVADAQKGKGKVFREVANQPFEKMKFVFPNFKIENEKDFREALLDSAYTNLLTAYYYHMKTNYVYDIADCLNEMGEVLQLQNKHSNAIDNFNQAYALAKSNGIQEKEKSAAYGLFTSYKALERHKESLYWFEHYNSIKDSIFNTSKERDLGRLESRHEFEAKEADLLAQQRQERILADAEKRRQQTILFLVSGGLAIVILLFAFLFNRFRFIQKQKKTIEHQKKIVDIKNEEITSSIQYAKRIQTAILPQSKILNQHLSEYFILYKPKDIVAGDFYWLESSNDNNKVFFTAADCTGHGVPGAMVSVMCSSALSKAVKELAIDQPAKILDKTVEIIEERFANSEEELKDGMDLALCCLDLKNLTLQYAGANNPLWLIKANKELIEIVPDKQPVGKFTGRKPFTNHQIKIEKRDTIYIFTDGYADQFGGEKGKKFKAKAFKDLLLSIQEKPMEEQKEIINSTFENWRGDLEQVDDVCVIGVRI